MNQLLLGLYKVSNQRKWIIEVDEIAESLDNSLLDKTWLKPNRLELEDIKKNKM